MPKSMTVCRERPILFSAPMIQALLDGRKTQTRRIVKPQPDERRGCYVCRPNGEHDGATFIFSDHDSFITGSAHCPYGKPGDRLWVKETHAMLYQKSECPVIAYRADDSARIVFNPPEGKFTLAGQAGEAASTWRAEHIRWRPSIHMPRWASRITLEITDVRVQRVAEITEEDAQAEGCGPDFIATAEWAKRHGHGDVPIAVGHRARFLQLFYDINKRAKRGSNPWVWALTFKVASHA